MLRFFTEVAPFADLRPQREIVSTPDMAIAGHAPLALATEDRATVVIYLPVGGDVSLNLTDDGDYTAQWYNPCTGELAPAEQRTGVFRAPQAEQKGHPQDWVVVLKR